MTRSLIRLCLVLVLVSLLLVALRQPAGAVDSSSSPIPTPTQIVSPLTTPTPGGPTAVHLIYFRAKVNQ
jgi:hypothetical protein